MPSGFSSRASRSEGRQRVGQVLQDLQGEDHVEALVGELIEVVQAPVGSEERDRDVRVGLPHLVAAALEHLGQQTVAAAEVEQDRPLAA